MQRRIINTNERDMINTLGMRGKLNITRVISDYDRLLVQYEHRGPFTYALLYEHELLQQSPNGVFALTMASYDSDGVYKYNITTAPMRQTNRAVKFLSVGTSKRSYTDKNNPATGEAVAFQRAVLNAFGNLTSSAVRFTSTKV